MLINIQLFAQIVKKIPGKYTNAIYLPQEDRIYALTASEALNGNSLCRINPQSLEVEACFLVGNDPAVLAATTDGSYIYIGLRGVNQIARFNLQKETVDLTFSTGGEDDFLGPFYAEEILPIKGQPNKIAVSLQNLCCSPRHEGGALFDNGVLLAKQTQDHTGANSIAYSDLDSILIGYNNETTEFGIRTIKVTDEGLEETKVYQLIEGFGVRIQFSAGKILASNGQVMTMANGIPGAGGAFKTPTTDGFYSRVFLSELADNSAFAIYEEGSNAYVMESYLSSSLNFKESTRFIAATTGGIRQFFRWGATDRLAFVSTSNDLILYERCTSAFTGIPLPIDDRQKVCFGQPFDLLPPAASTALGTILWSNGETGDTLTINSSGNFSYAILDATGCPGPFSPLVWIDQVFPPSSPFLEEPLSTVICKGGSINLGTNNSFAEELIWNTGDTAKRISVTEPGIYFAYYFLPENPACKSEPSNQIVLAGSEENAPAPPMIDLGSQVDTCTNFPVRLSAVETYDTYIWYVNEAVVSTGAVAFFDIPFIPEEIPTYLQLAVKNASGCLSRLSETTELVFYGQPSPPQIQYNEEANLLASSFNGPNRWYLNGVFLIETDGQFLTPAGGGFYAAQAVGTACNSELSGLLNLVITSTEEPQESAEVAQLFPNPTMGQVTVVLPEKLLGNKSGLDYQVLLTNSQGQLVKSIIKRGTSFELPLEDLPPGMYHLLIRMEGAYLSGNSLIRL